MKKPVKFKAPTQTTLGVSSSETAIRLDFGKEISWMEIPKPSAINFAILILQHCGVKVDAQLTPVPPREVV